VEGDPPRRGDRDERERARLLLPARGGDDRSVYPPRALPRRRDRADRTDDARVGEDVARHGEASGRAPRDGHFAGWDHDRGDPSPRGGRGPRRVPERDRCGAEAERGARAWRRGRGGVTLAPAPRRMRTPRDTKAKSRDHSVANLDPRDAAIVRAKNQLYAAGRMRRTH